MLTPRTYSNFVDRRSISICHLLLLHTLNAIFIRRFQIFLLCGVDYRIWKNRPVLFVRIYWRTFKNNHWNSRELHTYRPFDEKEIAPIHQERHLDSSIGDDQVVTSGSKKSSRLYLQRVQWIVAVSRHCKTRKRQEKSKDKQVLREQPIRSKRNA